MSTVRLCSTKENNRPDHWGLSSEKQRLGPHIVQFDPEMSTICNSWMSAGYKWEHLERVHQKQGLKFEFERDSKITNWVLLCQCYHVDWLKSSSRDAKTTHVIPRQSIWRTANLQSSINKQSKMFSIFLTKPNKPVACNILRVGELCYLVGTERDVFLNYGTFENTQVLKTQTHSQRKLWLCCSALKSMIY